MYKLTKIKDRKNPVCTTGSVPAGRVIEGDIVTRSSMEESVEKGRAFLFMKEGGEVIATSPVQEVSEKIDVGVYYITFKTQNSIYKLEKL